MIVDTQSAIALFDTGATCSCISYKTFQKIITNKKIINEKIQVVQADGHSLDPIGTVELGIQLGKEQFKYKFIVCKNLKTPIFLGLDFAAYHKIGFDWNADRSAYLRFENKELVSSIPKWKIEGTNSRLYTKKEVRLQPHAINLIEAEVSTPIKVKTGREIYQIRENELLNIEYPSIWVVETLQNQLDTGLASKSVVFIMNPSDKEIIIPKGITLAYLEETPFTAKRPKRSISSKEVNRKVGVGKVNVKNQVNEINRRKVKTTTVPLVPEDSALMMNEKFYPKPPVTLEDAKTSKQTELKFKQLLKKYDDIISKHSSDIGKTPLETMTIDVKPGSKPAASKPYNTALKHQEFLKQGLKALLESGVIERSMSPYAAPIIVVNRKCKPGAPLKEQKCLVIDYRKLNQQLVTAKSAQSKSKGLLALIPTPKIEHIWYKLRKAKYLSTIDLRSGYHHIPIAKEDCHKGAFVCEYGKFEFKRASFGISTCPDYLKSLMNKLFFDCDSFCIVYMDDLLVFSESEEEHLKHLEIIFKKFRNADLKLKLSKCQFWKKEIEYLGHLVSQEGIKVMPDKINTVLRIKPPSNVKEAKLALGIMGYIASFIPMYSEVVRHINRLMRKNVPFVWDQKCQDSLDLAKEILTSPPVLVYPDPNQEYHLFTDASNFTWSAALTQERVIQTPKGEESKFLPIAFHSGTFQGSEVNWAAFQKEAAAIHRGIK